MLTVEAEGPFAVRAPGLGEARVFENLATHERVAPQLLVGGAFDEQARAVREADLVLLHGADVPAQIAAYAALGGRPGTAQVTLATWFLGLAIGQVTQGTLSDRFGRRAPLIGGTLVGVIRRTRAASCSS